MSGQLTREQLEQLLSNSLKLFAYFEEGRFPIAPRFPQALLEHLDPSQRLSWLGLYERKAEELLETAFRGAQELTGVAGIHTELSYQLGNREKYRTT